MRQKAEEGDELLQLQRLIGNRAFTAYLGAQAVVSAKGTI